MKQIKSSATCKEAVELMNEEGVTCLFVTNSRNEVTGMLTPRDIIHSTCLASKSPTAVTVKSAKRPNIIVTQPGFSSQQLLSYMQKEGYHKIPVVDSSCCRIVSYTDVKSVVTQVVSTTSAPTYRASRIVGSIISLSPSLSSDVFVQDAIEYMYYNAIPAICVHDSTSHQLLGAFTDLDILVISCANQDFDDLSLVTLEDFLLNNHHTNIVATLPTCSLSDAMNIMVSNNVRYLPIVDTEENHNPIAILDLLDLCTALYFPKSGGSSVLQKLYRWMTFRKAIPKSSLQLLSYTAASEDDFLPNTTENASLTSNSIGYFKNSVLLPEFAVIPMLCKAAAIELFDAATLQMQNEIDRQKNASENTMSLGLEISKAAYTPVIHKLSEGIEALSKSTDDPEAWMMRAKMLAKRAIIQSIFLDQYQDAANDFESMIECASTYSSVRLLYSPKIWQSDLDEWCTKFVDTLVKLGRYEEAGRRVTSQGFYVMSSRTSCIQILIDESSDASANAKSSYALKKFPEALHLYNQAIRIQNVLTEIDSSKFKQDAILYNNRAACYLQMQDYHHSLQDAQMCVKIDSTYFKGWNRLVTCLERAGRYVECLQALDDAVLEHPEKVDVLEVIRARVSAIVLQKSMSNSHAEAVDASESGLTVASSPRSDYSTEEEPASSPEANYVKNTVAGIKATMRLSSKKPSKARPDLLMPQDDDDDSTQQMTLQQQIDQQKALEDEIPESLKEKVANIKASLAASMSEYAESEGDEMSIISQTSLSDMFMAAMPQARNSTHVA